MTEAITNSTAVASPSATQANLAAPSAKPADTAAKPVDPKAGAVAVKDALASSKPGDAPTDTKEALKEPVDGSASRSSKEDKEPELKSKDKESERWSALAKQEKQIQAQKAQFKEELSRERSAFENERKTHQQALQNAAQIEKEFAALRGNPRGVREFIEKHLNMRLEHLADDYIAGDTPDYKIKQLEARIAAKEAEAEEKAKREAAEMTTRQIQQNITNHKKAIADHLHDPGNIESYELTLKEFGDDAPNQLFSVIETHWKNTEKETGTGVLLSIDEAAKLTEETLEKMYVDRLKTKKLSKYAKPEETSPDVATKDKPAKPSDKADTVKANTPISEQPISYGMTKKTLTNKNSQTIPTRTITSRR